MKAVRTFRTALLLISEDEAPQVPFVSPVEDPDKASAAANLIGRQYPQRNKITMMAHSAAAAAQDRAAHQMMSAGDVEGAESRERSRDRHLYDPKGPLAGQERPKAFRFKAPRIPKKRGRKKKEVHVA